MSERKTKRTSRKKKEEEEPEDLRAKLKAKLYQAKLSRQPQTCLDDRLDKLEEQLENSKSHKEREQIRKQIALIEKIEENRQNSINDDYAQYDDKASYGGGIEHND